MEKKLNEKLSALIFLLAMTVVFLMPTKALAQKWSSDDDIPVVTVKKKYFLKSNRYEIGLQSGFIFNDSFVNSISFGGSLGYHFNEMFFAELAGGLLANSESQSNKDLQNNFGITPDTDDINFYGELHLGWSPIYGKLNFLSKKIIYFDTSLYAGGGVVDAEVSGISPAIVFGVAQRFVLTKWWALRLDVKDQVVIRDETGTAGSIRNVLGFYVGLNFFLPVK